MLNKLREATHIKHLEIEQGNLAGLIINHQIDLQQYKLLLLQNYIAYAVTEAKISNHLPEFTIEKSLQLKRDLQQLDIDTAQLKDFQQEFTVHNRAEAIGAAYVVEGSALGGMMISKEIKNCTGLSQIPQHHFFNGERDGLKNWRNFTKLLKSEEFSQQEESLAVNKALETFDFFGRVFKEARLS